MMSFSTGDRLQGVCEYVDTQEEEGSMIVMEPSLLNR